MRLETWLYSVLCRFDCRELAWRWHSPMHLSVPVAQTYVGNVNRKLSMLHGQIKCTKETDGQNNFSRWLLFSIVRARIRLNVCRIRTMKKAQRIVSVLNHDDISRYGVPFELLWLWMESTRPMDKENLAPMNSNARTIIRNVLQAIMFFVHNLHNYTRIASGRHDHSSTQIPTENPTRFIWFENNSSLKYPLLIQWIHDIVFQIRKAASLFSNDNDHPFIYPSPQNTNENIFHDEYLINEHCK